MSKRNRISQNSRNYDISFEDLKNQINIISGYITDSKLSLYSIMRDELFYLPAFFEHYRRFGVEQFIILDDASTDGTTDFLLSQPDCAVLRSKFRFGQEIEARMPDGQVQRSRAGTLFKRAIPEKFLAGRYALHADADEFLILPPEVPDFGTLLSHLKEKNIDCVAASLIEFYPTDICDITGDKQPNSFGEMIDLFPYFDAIKLIELKHNKFPETIGDSASKRLFNKYKIRDAHYLLRKLNNFLPPSVIEALSLKYVSSATLKTPIVNWRDGIWLKGSHNANVPPTHLVLLPMAHFKFTHALAEKTRSAIQTRAYAKKSRKYVHIDLLMDRMKEGDGNFVGSESQKYVSPQQLVNLGLMHWNL